MSEMLRQHAELGGLPSGYLRAEQAPFSLTVDGSILPWLGTRQMELIPALCEAQGGVSFYLASAIGTHPKLIRAANRLNSHQQANVDNMMYSRLPPFVQNHCSSLVEIVHNASTPFPIHVMRNQGGQRVYFSGVNLPTSEGGTVSTILRLGVCDKSDQELVSSLLAQGNAQIVHKTRKA